MKALKAMLFVVVLIGIPAMVGVLISEHRTQRHEPHQHVRQVSMAAHLVFCNDGREQFTTERSQMFLVVAKAKPAEDVENAVIGTPVAVLIVDTNGMARLYPGKMPVCKESSQGSM